MADPNSIWYRHHREIVQSRQDQLGHLIEQGTVKPLFLGHALIFLVLTLLALLIPAHRGSRYVRPATFILILSIALDVIKHRRAVLGCSGYMFGIISAWWIIWSATLLVFNNVETDFKRIERPARPSVGSQGGSNTVQLNGNGHVAEKSNSDQSLSTVDGIQSDGQVSDDKSTINPPRKQHSSEEAALIWQSYPSSFLHRLNWVSGLVLNLRGPEWNWRISSLGPLPPSVQAQLNGRKSSPERHDTFPDAKTQLKNAFVSLLMSYLCIDVLKVLMMQDPYFLGMTSHPPTLFPFSLLTPVPTLVRLYRLLFTGLGVFSALTLVPSLGPLFFLGLSTMFPGASRAVTSTPLDAPWLYSPTFGPFIAPILDNGLAGCWGMWWHQSFRFGFTQTARWLLSLLPVKLATNRGVSRFVTVFVAFSLSGFLHACGSYTQLTNTRPLSGPFLFFFLQAVGVVIQRIFTKTVLPRLVLPHTVPQWLRRTGNATFVFSWLFLFSGAFIADDFARGGLWLVEPLPVSLVRGLGFGAEGEGWWCWKEPWFRYRDGGSFWQLGVQVL